MIVIPEYQCKVLVSEPEPVHQPTAKEMEKILRFLRRFRERRGGSPLSTHRVPGVGVVVFASTVPLYPEGFP
jgi:hypothetical protein